MAANFVLSGHNLILERDENRKGLSEVNKMDGLFLVDFLAKNSRTLNVSCSEALPWWRIHLSGQGLGVSSEKFP
jgi:hypothetical protein